MKDTYDLAIIGGGAAGLIAVPFAVKLGVRVAFIEKDRIAGDCLLTFSQMRTRLRKNLESECGG